MIHFTYNKGGKGINNLLYAKQEVFDNHTFVVLHFVFKFNKEFFFSLIREWRVYVSINNLVFVPLYSMYGMNYLQANLFINYKSNS